MASARASLRQFMARVHPDRFRAGSEAERDNLKSFQVLQSFLQNTDTMSSARERVNFHISDEDGRPARKVSCELRAASLDADIRFLLRQCGIVPPADGSAVSPRASPRFDQSPMHMERGPPSWWAMRQPRTMGREKSLAAYLSEHAADCRRRHSETARQQDKSEALRARIASDYSVDVELVDRFIPSAKLRILSDVDRQLRDATAATLGVLQQCRIRISAGVEDVDGGLDMWGRLVVSEHVVQRQGLALLAAGLDTQDMLARHHRNETLLGAEARAAEALHLARLSTSHDGLRCTEAYTNLLGAIADLRTTHSGKLAEQLSRWGEAVQTDAESASGRSRAQGAGRSLWEGHVDSGSILLRNACRTSMGRLVHMPVTTSEEALVNFLATAGVVEAARMAARDRHLERARRAVGAVDLKADACLTEDQVRRACDVLEDARPDEAHGLSLLISLSFGATEDGTLKVRHDCDR